MQQFLRIVLLAFMGSLVGCADSNSHPPSTPLRAESAIERRATLSMLHRAWDERPEGISEDHCWYERRLLDRGAFFGRKIRNTETYRDACTFWMSCLREHIERYDDERYTRH